MPGMVAFRRRWSVGSDDLVVPAVFLVILHTAWIVVLSLVRGLVHFETAEKCTEDLQYHILGYIGILGVCLVLEVIIAVVSLRGTILSPEPRSSMEYLLYIRLFFGILELAWLIVGAVWSGRHYQTCKPEAAKKALLGIMVCNWIMMLSCIISVWCTYDTAGAKWVKMKKFQDSLKERRRVNRRQSGSRRNWRQRKAFRAYEESWDRRLQLLCCCVERKGRNQSSMSEIAQLFTEFFRDLDVVPSDVVAGLVLLRHHQKQRMKMVIAQGDNGIYQYLSGVPITPNTRFLQLTQPEVMGEFIKVIHYMRFALAAYGWPVFVMMSPCTWLCRLLPVLSCCCCSKGHPHSTVVDDNCCGCNFASLKRISGLHDIDIVYATYHVDIGETPFYVALDHEFGKVVVCVRGTLSLQDVLTDLKAEPETLPLQPPRDDWQGHKGMVQAALYIKKKLIDDKILEMAWERDEGRDVAKYDLVCVGHSLGAGTAAILAILLKNEYPSLHCYAFSPPGGLLTLPCVEETKSYITSVVIGKDVVPRIGLPQLEMLRTDIINLLKNSRKSKWNIISKGFCCCSNERFFDERNLYQERDVTAHPSNSQIGLSAHAPLYPPGKMIHVVRSHASDKKSGCKSSEPIYQALWASNADFDEVLVSPTMINDHMPDNVLESLEKVLLRIGPQKPVRTMTEAERQAFMSLCTPSASTTPSPSQAQGFLETSFTSDTPLRLQPPSGPEGDNPAQSWDYVAEQILQSTSPGDVVLSDSYVKPGLQEVPRNPRMPTHFTLPLSSEPVHAPLASPETLSMASGILLGITGPHGTSNSDGSQDNQHHARGSSSPPKIAASYHPSSSRTAPASMMSFQGASKTNGEFVLPEKISKHRNRSTGNEKRDSMKGDENHVKHGQNDRGDGPCMKHDRPVPVKKNAGKGPSMVIQGSAHWKPGDAELGAREHTATSKYIAGTEVSPQTSLSHGDVPRSQSWKTKSASAVFSVSSAEAQQTYTKNNPEKTVAVKTRSEAIATGLDSSSAGKPIISSGRSQEPNPEFAMDNGDMATLPADTCEAECNLTVRKSTGAPEDSASGAAILNTCPRNSPVETTQGEYEHPNLYYSQASTGYPHGAYHPPIRYPTPARSRGRSSHLRSGMPSSTSNHPHRFVHCQSESSIFSKHLPPKLSMKRSAEQTDICHLIDEAEVFDGDKDLFAIKRSAEQTDISHLQDDTDVFELEDTLGELSTLRGRLPAVHSTPHPSMAGSPLNEEGGNSRCASSSRSSRSDDVFESQGAIEVQGETDV